MSTEEVALVSFLTEVMRRRRRLPNQLAADSGVSHATVSRWLSGDNVPDTHSCHKLAEYSGVPPQKVLAIAGHLPRIAEQVPAEWPEFGEYARRKYPNELDEDYKNVYVDFSNRAVSDKYYESLRKVIDKLSAKQKITLKERILFGSDFAIHLMSIESYNKYLDIFSQNTSFDDEEKNSFCCTNPERFLFC